MRVLESNSKKQVPPHWNRKPKPQQEKKEFGKAKEEGVPVRGKHKPRNLGDSYDDKQIDSNFKKQNKSKKPSKDTIRKGEEDEQSVLKNMKKNGGKATFDENTNIEKFIESILTKNYAAADKYIKQAVECKLQGKIEQELSTPLF